METNNRAMKTIQQLLFAFLVISISSCISESIGPQGLQGPEGPEGPQGAEGESSYVFEYTGINFTAPDYEVYLEYPIDFEGLDSDVTLVYLLWEVTTDSNGDHLEVWRQVPQTILTENGLLQYNFDFSKIDFHLFITTEFDSSLLQSFDTDDWVVRAVVIPGEFWNGRSSLDFSDYNAVKEAYNLPELAKHEDIHLRR